jgi:hypothetical protein
MPEPIQIVAGVSMILGLLLLLTSALFVDQLKDAYCPGDTCGDIVRWAKASGSFGIIASLLQIASFPVAWFNKGRIWLVLHIAIFILTLTAYSIAVDRQTNWISSKAKAFMSFAAIDMTFSAFATVAGYHLTEMN